MKPGFSDGVSLGTIFTREEVQANKTSIKIAKIINLNFINPFLLYLILTLTHEVGRKEEVFHLKKLESLPHEYLSGGWPFVMAKENFAILGFEKIRRYVLVSLPKFT